MTITGDQSVSSKLVSLEDIQKAHERIKAHVHRTPLLTSSTLDQLATHAIQDKLTGAKATKSSSSLNDGNGVMGAGTESSNSAIHTTTPHDPIKVHLAFKAEHLQRIGAFKMRGATNAIKTHLERLQQSSRAAAPAVNNGSSDAAPSSSSNAQHFDPTNLWVVTHSSGNHAAALACAARSVGAKAGIVMPRNAPQVKKAAVAGYGAHIVECEPTQAAREAAAQQLIEDFRKSNPGSVVQFVHPYDEELVICGQGTLGIEMVQQADALQQGRRRCSEAPVVEEDRRDDGVWQQRDGRQEPVLDIVVAPIGGGGMMSGVSTAVKGMDPRIVVIGAEPELADDAARSFYSNVLQPAVTPAKTVCDGLLTALSPRTLKHIQTNVTDILTASDDEILAAMRLVWERMKQVIEPSAAVGLAVVLSNPRFAEVVQRVAAQKGHGEVRIGIVWTGGNVEIGKMAAAFS